MAYDWSRIRSTRLFRLDRWHARSYFILRKDVNTLIYIGLGSNLPSPDHGDPTAVVRAAAAELKRIGLAVVRESGLWRSAPVPRSDQPWFFNAVVAATSPLRPSELLEHLHAVEARFGRVRRERNEARVVDLDLLDFEGQVSPAGAVPILPHPRLAERAFVLRPLAEIAPGWRHPVSGAGIDALLAALDPSQVAEKTGP